MKTKLVICLFFAFLGMAKAQTIIGIASNVHDGDTFRLIKTDGSFIKVRLANIDAPEITQAYGIKSRDFLDSCINKKTVKVEIQTIDRYGRSVGILSVNGKEINRLLVFNGLAWHYPKYSKDKGLASIETKARGKKIGLWSDKTPMAPWEFRAAKQVLKNAS